MVYVKEGREELTITQVLNGLSNFPKNTEFYFNTNDSDVYYTKTTDNSWVKDQSSGREDVSAELTLSQMKADLNNYDLMQKVVLITPDDDLQEDIRMQHASKKKIERLRAISKAKANRAKRIKEATDVEFNSDRVVDVSPNYTVPDVITMIQQAMDDEIEAIDRYDQLKAIKGWTQDEINMINEIQGDEEDHLVNLSQLNDLMVQRQFPDRGDLDETTDINMVNEPEVEDEDSADLPYDIDDETGFPITDYDEQIVDASINDEDDDVLDEGVMREQEDGTVVPLEVKIDFDLEDGIIKDIELDADDEDEEDDEYFDVPELDFDEPEHNHRRDHHDHEHEDDGEYYIVDGE